MNPDICKDCPHGTYYAWCDAEECPYEEEEDE